MNPYKVKSLLFDLRRVLEELEKEVGITRGLLTDKDYEDINEGLKQSPLRGPVNPPYPNKLGDWVYPWPRWTPNKDGDVN